MKSNKRGITLIEVLFVLGIMAILIGIVMVFLSLTTQSNKINEFIQEGYSIKQIVSSLCDEKQSCMKQDQTSSIIKSGLLPSKYINGDNLVDPWGGTLSSIVFPDWLESTTLLITLNITSSGECIKLMSFESSTEAWNISGYNKIYPNISDYVNLCNSLSYPTSFTMAL